MQVYIGILFFNTTENITFNPSVSVDKLKQNIIEYLRDNEFIETNEEIKFNENVTDFFEYEDYERDFVVTIERMTVDN